MRNPLLARQIAVLYLEFLGRQVPPELLKKISAKSNAVERTFNVYRYDVGGKKLTDNDISRILVESRDSDQRQAAWEARMTIGRAVIADLKAVVALRNEAARKLGFKNFHAMQLYLSEQSDEQVLKLFDELDELTREPYPQGQGRDRRRVGEKLRDHGRGASAVALSRSVFRRSARRAGRSARVGLQADRHAQDLPRRSTTASGCRSTTC